MVQLPLFNPFFSRRLLCIVFLGFLFPVTAGAQSNSAALLKEARKNHSAYRKTRSDKASLQMARQSLDEAFRDPSLQRDAEALLLKGDIYQDLCERELMARKVDKDSPLSADNPALVAFEAFQKAFSAGNGKKEMKEDLLKRLTGMDYTLLNAVIGYYETKKTAQAYALSRALFTNKQLLKDNGQTSTLDTPGDFETALGVLWGLSKETGAVSRDADFIMDVLLKGPETAQSYIIYYELAVAKGNAQAAEEAARKGYEKYPENTELLFSLINVYVTTQQFQHLVPLLKKGIELEPANVGLYVVLAQVYESNYNKYGYEFDFNESVGYYTKALNIQKDHGDALYSLGALYFNKAAKYSSELSKGGLSAGEQEKKTREMNNQLDLALPWFKKAEAQNPNDPNTLMALSRIYGIKGDTQLAGEFSKRLERVQNGGKNASPYFPKQ